MSAHDRGAGAGRDQPGDRGRRAGRRGGRGRRGGDSGREGLAGHPDDPARQSPPPRVEEALQAFVRDRGWERRLEGARVHEVWEEIAGPSLARHIEPVRLHGGVLVVRAASAAWATEVRFLTAELVRRSNAVLGEGQVRSVTVVTGQGRE